MPSCILSITCANRPGIVAAVTNGIYTAGGDITEAQQFDDRATGQFFMRVVFSIEAERLDAGALTGALREPVQRFSIDLTLRRATERRKVVIMVSKQDHCLGDLLYRVRIGELPIDVVGIISNHPREVLNVSMIGDIPYHHLPVNAETKARQEARVREIIEDTQADLVVLARYMQILSDGLCQFLAGRCVNIHHSFLPGFKGAKPYHQAHERGVKLIEAAAHLVTGDLEEGPLIEQDGKQFTRADSPEDLVRKARDIERRVLALAVTYLVSDRVLLNGRK